jgi:hypothetical protein
MRVPFTRNSLGKVDIFNVVVAMDAYFLSMK